MMATVLILFQFSILSRDVLNNYNDNVYAEETNLTRAEAWSEQSASDATETVVYIGGKDDAAAKIIRQWCGYSKRLFAQFDLIDDYFQQEVKNPTLICLDGEAVTDALQINDLRAMVRNGQNVLFCNIPQTQLITHNLLLMELLGIRQVAEEQTELTGIHLFPGFLLGGEAIYTVKEEEEKLNSEVRMSAPWFLRLSGTKCYMAGTLEDDAVENEDLPPLIWRNSFGLGRVFVVNGPYMQDETGLGILSAITYELRDYVLYPAVNAQNLSVANFPVFAEENTDELTKIYARDLSDIQSSLMWPGLILAANRENYRMTCFLTPQLDYSAKNKSKPDQLTFYLKQFREQNTEAGLSLDHLPGIDLADKLTEDQSFFDSSYVDYPYNIAYVGSKEKEDFLAAGQQGVLKNIHSVTGVWNDADLLSYCTDTILAQGITANGFTHSYLQDLKVRGIQTAIGYSNILLDMKYVAWPEDVTQHWERLSKAFSSNINTYWKPFSEFEKTTLSESDSRVRSFLSLDYTDVRNDDTITANITGDGSHWLILRTHDEKISGITGGEYTEIEDNAYLIYTEESSVQIELDKRQNKQYYLK